MTPRYGCLFTSLLVLLCVGAACSSSKVMPSQCRQVGNRRPLITVTSCGMSAGGGWAGKESGRGPSGGRGASSSGGGLARGSDMLSAGRSPSLVSDATSCRYAVSARPRQCPRRPPSRDREPIPACQT